MLLSSDRSDRSDASEGPDDSDISDVDLYGAGRRCGGNLEGGSTEYAGIGSERRRKGSGNGSGDVQGLTIATRISQVRRQRTFHRIMGASIFGLTYMSLVHIREGPGLSHATAVNLRRECRRIDYDTAVPVKNSPEIDWDTIESTG